MVLFFIIQIILTLCLILLFFIVFFTVETFSIGLIPSIILSVFLTYFSALILLAFFHKISRILMRTKEGEIEGFGVILWAIQATTLDIALTLTRKLFIHSPVPDIIYSLFGFKRRKGVSILTTIWDPKLPSV